jgi:prolyl oligopeptidase
MTPAFSRSAYLWLEHGGVYAVANLRGGAEFGEDWHRAGMLEKKQNVFDDFIAAAEHLIAAKYTDRRHLATQGGSNGGLLMGAMITQRPELFRAVICAVPLLDMLRYQNFQIAKLWIPEYGSSEDPKQFEWLYAYSPYHHVKAGTEYPAILFMTADTDTRVDPMHAKKMAALMQADASLKIVYLRGFDLPLATCYKCPFCVLLNPGRTQVFARVGERKLNPTRPSSALLIFNVL